MNGAGVLAFAIAVEINPGRLAVNQSLEAVTGRGGRVMVRKTGRYRTARAIFGEAVMLKIEAEGLAPLVGPLSVTVKAFWPRTIREGPAAGLALGDADAPLKGVLDALEEGGLFGNDAQVVAVTGEKAVAGDRPRVLAWVYALQ